ncbi:hypothetical protein IU500_28110 [Nocardia terpenica]|uniref:hypothetical protein n=1 Tax=Nocardia terpenica TaxID=455432 RepID=UPI001895F43C|nr:hypothetical protein [Nocardia terpenica]MBF6065150.1 hypothetical protein [Nocardia terpenica]MBF6107878.1 hypothetical protein [Nocardia terpenica]MBF6115591.1 hypothetical protein [Nocardia terpenica]MBF6122028.1 hypothetical protein [Nocardia terpenica]MBF6155428.1 hypothetical protein [Nocardia terpenica]
MAATAAGTVALFVAIAPPAAANWGGCSGQVCLEVEGSGLYVARLTVTPAPGAKFYGRMHLYGPGIKGDSALMNWHKGSRYSVGVGHGVNNHTKFCAEGREHDASGTVKRGVGRACVDVHQ